MNPIYEMQYKGGFACGKTNWPFDKDASDGWRAGWKAGQALLTAEQRTLPPHVLMKQQREGVK